MTTTTTTTTSRDTTTTTSKDTPPSPAPSPQKTAKKEVASWSSEEEVIKRKADDESSRMFQRLLDDRPWRKHMNRARPLFERLGGELSKSTSLPSSTFSTLHPRPPNSLPYPRVPHGWIFTGQVPCQAAWGGSMSGWGLDPISSDRELYQKGLDALLPTDEDYEEDVELLKRTR